MAAIYALLKTVLIPTFGTQSASEKDRSLALKLLQELPGRRLHSIGIF